MASRSVQSRPQNRRIPSRQTFTGLTLEEKYALLMSAFNGTSTMFQLFTNLFSFFTFFSTYYNNLLIFI